MAAFAERLPSALLTTGPATVRLTNREIDLLRMLETIGAALGFSADGPGRALGENGPCYTPTSGANQWPGLPLPRAP